MEKGKSEVVKVVRSRLMWVAVLPPRDMVMSGPVWFMTRMERGSRLMYVAHDTTKGQEDREVQSWPCLLLAARLGRTGPAPQMLKHSGERVLHLT